MRPTNDFEPLNSDELLFLWKGLVDDGKLTAERLIDFMERVAGVSISTVQARDLLNYMDANGDGRVGKEDFENFLSVGRLDETDPKSFMWEPKKKFREENPFHKAGHEAAMPADSTFLTDGRKKSLSPVDMVDLTAPPVPPDSKVPDKRRPQPGGRRGSKDHGDAAVPLEANGSGNGKQPKPQRLAADFRKSTGLTSEQEKKVEHALLKYEQQQWDKFIREEKEFKRHLFEQFAGQGESELHYESYHRMLSKWFPMASKCDVPRLLRPADSLAAMEYVQRRDNEDKGIVPQHQVQDGGNATDAVDASLHAAARMTYSMWLDVLNGKHRPDEHVHDLRHHHGQTRADDEG